MIAVDWLKRTPFRLALTFLSLFSVATIVLFTIVYFGISARLENNVRTRIAETSSTLAAFDDPMNFAGMVAMVTAESATVRDSDFVFELLGSNGEFLAGNVRGIAHAPGWLTLRRADIFLTVERGRPDDIFHASWRPLSKGFLLVGHSDHEVKQMQTFLIDVLRYGLIVTALIGAASAAFLGWRAERRINTFANTLSAVSLGRIDARVPISQSGDDIDQIGLQINRTLDQLRRLIENVNQSSADIAHDLKKPVSRLRQKLEQSKDAVSTGAEHQLVVDDAIVEIDRIMETFDALLRISQIEAGARKSRFDAIDLSAVLREVVDVYVPVVEDAGGSLTLRPTAHDAAPILGDRELLAQLFANLIENAIRHSAHGPRIEVTLSDTARAFCVSVCDDGPGIPKEERENVFRRLYRLERARSTPGSGLGLSLAAAICELHGTSIRLFDNNPGLIVELHFPEHHRVQTYKTV